MDRHVLLKLCLGSEKVSRDWKTSAELSMNLQGSAKSCLGSGSAKLSPDREALTMLHLAETFSTSSGDGDGDFDVVDNLEASCNCVGKNDAEAVGKLEEDKDCKL